MELAHQLWQAQSEERGKVVLLHGLGGIGALWRPIAASLEDHYTLLAPDQRGHGGSRIKQNSYTPGDFGADVIDTLKVRSFHPVWMIGHSMGVRSAVASALLKPDWFRGLVLVDLGLTDSSVGAPGLELARFLETLPEQFQTRASAREFMTRHCPDPSIGQYLLAVSTVSQDGNLSFPFDREALVRIIHSAQNASLLDSIRRLGGKGMPILLLRGGESLVWKKDFYEAEKSALGDLPSVRFEEFAGTGHGLPFEKRVLFVKRLREFFGDSA